ncbi:MAG: hydrolase, partial [Firmicutes bacterium]|nr:hydrolase [Bacillota bacterium]
MRIIPEETMALTIDMQEKLVPAMNESQECVDNVLLLMNGLNELGIPQIISQQYTKGLGMSI